MPLYEYRCKACDAVEEVLIRNPSEQPVCPLCGSKRLEKLLSVAAAPAVSGGQLPLAASADRPTCGRPQCGSGCMFE